MSRLFGKHVHTWWAVMLIVMVAGMTLLAEALRVPGSLDNNGGTLVAKENHHDAVTGENQFSPIPDSGLSENHPASHPAPDNTKETAPPLSFRNDPDEKDRIIDHNHPIFIEAVPEPQTQDADGQGGMTFIVKPSQTIQLDPDGLEWIHEIGGGTKEPVSGILITALNITTEGGMVILDFSMENISEDSLDLRYGSGRKFDFTVNDDDGGEVYRWSHDKCFTTAIVDLALGPGERLSFTEVWEFVDNDGQPVPADEYTVTVMMCPRLKDGRTINPDELIANYTIKVE